MTPKVLVLGGGLSGVAAAYTLARAGWSSVTVVESAGSLGGLAGSFEREGRFYPLGYHHILHRDRTLLFFLELIGALPAVRWRRIRIRFAGEGGCYDLSRPVDFLRFPMTVRDKLGFVRLMAKAFRKRDWSDWYDRSAAELVDRYAGEGARAAIFEPLMRLKFELPCAEVSGAWLGARLHYREGSAPLGYIPGANWTTVLCDGVARLLEKAGVTVRLATRVARLHVDGDRIAAADLTGGERIGADVFVSTIPTEALTGMLPREDTPGLASIRYSALISVVCATRQRVRPDVYWTNLTAPGRTASAIFLLSALNPTIGSPGDSCVNFVTHLASRARPLFRAPDQELLDRYREDFRAVFGFGLEPFWTHVARVPMYSPVFVRSFRSPPARSATWRNLYFGGNYRTFPSIVSTGTALQSGLETGGVVLADHGGRTELAAMAAAFRLQRMPR